MPDSSSSAGSADRTGEIWLTLGKMVKNGKRAVDWCMIDSDNAHTYTHTQHARPGNEPGFV